MRNHKAVILATVCAAVLAINLDTTIVNVALPSISRELDAGTRQLQWVVDAYNLAFAGLVLAAGSLSDRFGRRPALIVGLVGFALASAAGALVTSGGALVAARFAMGTFAALIFPTTLSIISNTFRERRERAAALGIWGAVVGLGVAMGPITGGVLLEQFYWGSVFWALVPLALVTAVAAYLFVPESRDPSVPGLDGVGLVVSVAMLASLTYTIIEAPSHGWSSAATLGGVAAPAAPPDHRGADPRLVAGRHSRRVRRRGRPARVLRDLGAPFEPSDARRHALQGPSLQRSERRGDDHVLRAVRLHLPGDAVLPVRARLRCPVDGRADPAGRLVDRGGLGGGCGGGAADRDQDRGHHRDGALRHGVPVDLHGRRRHVVLPRDRAADGDDGTRHGPDLHARD